MRMFPIRTMETMISIVAVWALGMVATMMCLIHEFFALRELAEHQPQI
jgi:hypothetical protein